MSDLIVGVIFFFCWIVFEVYMWEILFVVVIIIFWFVGEMFVYGCLVLNGFWLKYFLVLMKGKKSFLLL